MRRMLSDDRGQNALEYLLVGGTLMVAVLAALMGLDAVLAEVVAHVCPSVDTADALVAIGSCITGS